MMRTSRSSLISPASRRGTEWLAALAVALIETAFIFRQVSLHALQTQTFYSRDDPMLCAWTLETVRRAFLRHPFNFFNGNIFFPLHRTLAFTDHLLGLQPVYAVVRLFTGNVVFALNLLILVSSVLCFLSMFGYLRPKLGAALPALAGATLFAYNAPRLAQLGHVQLVVLFWMPMAIGALERLIEKPSKGRVAVFSILASLQFLSAYYLGYSFLVYAVIHAAVLLRGRPAKAVYATLAAFGAVAIFAAAYSWPYLLVEQHYDHRGDLANIIGASADFISSYFSACIHSPLWGDLLNPPSGNMQHESWLFYGFICYGLVASFLDWHFRRRGGNRRVAIAWILGLAALALLSFGPVIVWFGHPTRLPLPYLLLYHLVPGFSAISVPARIGLVAAFPLSAMAATYCDRGLHRDQIGALAVLALTAGALWESRLDLIMVDATSLSSVPPVYAWLSHQSYTGGVLDWPIGRDGLGPSDYMYFELTSGLPTVHGHSGMAPRSYDEILAHFAAPTPDDFRYLKAIGVNLIVDLQTHDTEEHRLALRQAVRRGDLKLIYADSESVAYENAAAVSIAPALSLQPNFPFFANTDARRRWGVILSTGRDGAVWKNPSGRAGVDGEIRYTASDGHPLRLHNAWLRKPEVVHGAVTESLKLLPIAALDGEVVYPTAQVDPAELLAPQGRSAIRIDWHFDPVFHLPDQSIAMVSGRRFERAFRPYPRIPGLRVSSSDNSAALGALMDGRLDTRWSSRRFLGKGMYLEVSPPPGIALSGLRLWLGSSYLDYPTAFRVTTGRSDGARIPEKFQFIVVGRPDLPNENRLELHFDRNLASPIRIEVMASPLEGNWWWSIAELEPIPALAPPAAPSTLQRN